jgi:hypothetical protein
MTARGSSRRRPGVWLWLTASLVSAATPRELPAAPAEREAAIVSRALTFERSLNERVGDRVIGIAVLHRSADAASERCAAEWQAGFAPLSGVKIQDRNLAFKSLSYSAEAIGSARASGIHVFVVCPGLSQEAAEITRASRSQRILTVGTLLSYVEQSMTFGVFREQDRYQMVVNLRTASAEGVTFSSSMLKLARVLR